MFAVLGIEPRVSGLHCHLRKGGNNLERLSGGSSGPELVRRWRVFPGEKWERIVNLFFFCGTGI
jgi:hypothetical protein